MKFDKYHKDKIDMERLSEKEALNLVECPMWNVFANSTMRPIFFISFIMLHRHPCIRIKNLYSYFFLFSTVWIASLVKGQDLHIPTSDSRTHFLPIEYINPDELPTEFTWQNIGGTSFLTMMLNQHIPQYW